MGSRKTVLMNLFAGQQWRHIENRLTDPGKGREGEGGMNGDSSMGIYTLPYVNCLARGNLLYDSGNSIPALS